MPEFRFRLVCIANEVPCIIWIAMHYLNCNTLLELRMNCNASLELQLNCNALLELRLNCGIITWIAVVFRCITLICNTIDPIEDHDSRKIFFFKSIGARKNQMWSWTDKNSWCCLDCECVTCHTHLRLRTLVLTAKDTLWFKKDLKIHH
jgi:hypothetical protein